MGELSKTNVLIPEGKFKEKVKSGIFCKITKTQGSKSNLPEIRLLS